MKVSVSRLYQIQKRVAAAMAEAASRAQSIIAVEVGSVSGTKSESDQIQKRFLDAEVAFERYLTLSDLYGWLRRMVAEASNPATSIRSSLEVVNQKIKFLEGILQRREEKISIDVEEIPNYLENKKVPENTSKNIFAERETISISRRNANLMEENLRIQLSSLRKESIKLQEKIAKINQKSVNLDSLPQYLFEILEEEFMG